LNEIWLNFNQKYYARFQKNDMQRLCEALQLPEKYTCYQGTSTTGMEALMIMLRRLVYPNRWCDLVPLFQRAEPELSLIFNEVIKTSMHRVIFQ